LSNALYVGHLPTGEAEETYVDTAEMQPPLDGFLIA